jgi:tRNA(Ile)-lysidine synthase
MARETPLDGLMLVRPLIDLPKARLIATLDSIGMSFADDPSNRDPRFTRARLRGLMHLLAAEGLDAQRLALLARRLRRAEATIETAVDAAVAALCPEGSFGRGLIVLDAQKFNGLPAEVSLRLLGRAIARAGDEGPVQLGKLEALHAAFAQAQQGRQTSRLRRTLAGALVTLAGERLSVERAPPRSFQKGRGSTTLTTRKHGRGRPSKGR